MMQWQKIMMGCAVATALTAHHTFVPFFAQEALRRMQSYAPASWLEAIGGQNQASSHRGELGRARQSVLCETKNLRVWHASPVEDR